MIVSSSTSNESDWTTIAGRAFTTSVYLFGQRTMMTSPLEKIVVDVKLVMIPDVLQVAHVLCGFLELLASPANLGVVDP